MSDRTFYLSIFILVMLATAFCYTVYTSGTDAVETTTKPRRKQNVLVRKATKSHLDYLKSRDVRWQVKVNKLRNIDNTALSDLDINELYDLLHYNPLLNESEEWWVVMNEIMEQMRLKGIGRERYADALMAIISDNSADIIKRDYAIQHLCLWLAPRGDIQQYEENPDIVLKGINLLTSTIELSSAREGSVPGTALMGLVDIYQSGHHLNKIESSFDELEPWMRSVIRGKDSDLLTQTSAVNVAGIMKLKTYLPEIRNFAFSTEVHDNLKLSSIAALGYLADPQDQEALERIAAKNSKFKYAAQSALKRLKN